MLLSLNSIFVSLTLWVIDGNCWNLPDELPHRIKEDIMKQIKIWKYEEEPP